MTQFSVLDAASHLVERLAKATARESWREIHRIADKARPEWVAAFISTIKAAAKGIDKAKLAAALERGNVADAVASIEWHTMDAALAQQFYAQITDLALEGAKIAAGDAALTVDWVEQAAPAGGGKPPRVPRVVPPVGGAPNFDLRFDLVNAKSFDAIRAYTADLVVEVGIETKGAIKGLVERSFREGVPPAKLGREVREHIGLTTRQSTAVGNYRTFLEDLSARSDLSTAGAGTQARLARGLPSSRSVRPVMRRGLAPDRIDAMVERYSGRLLADRAENIARTETINAANAGQRLLWEEGVKQGAISPSRMRQRWIITPDDRLCELCEQMVGDHAYAEIGEPFVHPDGTEVDGPTLHVRCRCAVGLERQPEAAA